MDENRKGICTNIGNCKNADSKLPIEISLTADFICPECERELLEIKGRKPFPIKKVLLITIPLLVIGLLIWGGIALFSGKNNQTSKPTIKNNREQIVKDSIAKADSIKKISMQLAKDSIAKAKTVSIKNGKGTSVSTGNPPPPPSGGKKTLSLASGDSYYGETKNGIMHGMGTYYYKSKQLISPKDRKKRYAEAGDYIIGEWYDGNLVQGKLFGSNGNQKEAIMIGAIKQ